MNKALNRLLAIGSGASIVLLLASRLLIAANGGPLDETFKAPDFTQTNPHDWLNSRPLKMADLKGKVVLLDFWTFECWNCYRSFPWMTGLESRLRADGLHVIGVHTPEFEHEKVRENVIVRVREFNLHHPVMIDNDFVYWNAMGNRFWPAFYIIDRQGMVRGVFYGETHEGDQRAIAIETLIKELLKEPA